MLKTLRKIIFTSGKKAVKETNKLKTKKKAEKFDVAKVKENVLKFNTKGNETDKHISEYISFCTKEKLEQALAIMENKNYGEGRENSEFQKLLLYNIIILVKYYIYNKSKKGFLYQGILRTDELMPRQKSFFKLLSFEEDEDPEVYAQRIKQIQLANKEIFFPVSNYDEINKLPAETVIQQGERKYIDWSKEANSIFAVVLIFCSNLLENTKETNMDQNGIWNILYMAFRNINADCLFTIMKKFLEKNFNTLECLDNLENVVNFLMNMEFRADEIIYKRKIFFYQSKIMRNWEIN